MKTLTLPLLLVFSLQAYSQLDTNDFVTTWKTDNSGILSNDNSIYLTTVYNPVLAYNYDVDWNNDGVFDTLGVTGDISHQYAVPGTYTIRIRGDFPGVFFGGYVYFGGSTNIRDSKKLISIDQWGNSSFKWLYGAFRLCENMNVLATDSPNLDSLSNLTEMFYGCSSLNANLNHWDVSHITDMEGMFREANSYNQPMDSWDVSNVTNMQAMFYGASRYNQPLDSWDVSNVADMSYMFYNAFHFNQNLGAWSIVSVTDFHSTFLSSNLSVENYDSTLIAWDAKPHQQNVDFGYQYHLEYCAAEIARDSLIADGWYFFGDALNCHPEDFVTLWKTDLPGVSNDSALTIFTDPTFNYNYDIDWEDDGVYDTLGATGNIFHQYNSPGLYTVRIRGDFPSIKFGQGDKGKLAEIAQWGSIPFQSLEHAFDSCSSIYWVHSRPINLDSTTSLNYMFKSAGAGWNIMELDGWDVSNIKSMQGLFENSGFAWPGIDSWDVSNVTNMNAMFKNSAFTTFTNGSPPHYTANNWDVSSVTDMSEMFSGASSFNIDISSWDVSSVTDMSNMFSDATSFNQPLNSWDVSNAGDMSWVFYNATSFNQPLSNWNVQYVGSMIGMFYNATSFNQNLGSWNIWTVLSMHLMLSNSGLSVANYDSTLIGWEAGSHQSNLALGADSLSYCLGKAARDSLIADGWGINGDSLHPNCSSNPLNDFVTTWKTDNPGTLSNDSSIFINAQGNQNQNFNYDVDWNNDGIFDTLGVTGDISHQYSAPGTYTIRIRGKFPILKFGGDNPGQWSWFNGDHKKLISIDQWGAIPFKRLRSAFENCENMNVLATDAPVLDSVDQFSLSKMFFNCTSLNPNINHWDVSRIKNMQMMFYNATSFNSPLNNWTVDSLQNANEMLGNTSSFNQNLGNWKFSKGTASSLWGMLDYSGLSLENYDSTLIGWANNSQPDSLIVGVTGLNYCLAKNERDSLIAKGWVFLVDSYNCASAGDFVTTWQAGILNLGNAADSMVFIPTKSGYNYNYNVDWDNDGIFDTLGVTGPINHKYNSQGLKTVRISGDYPALAFNNSIGLISVDQWGSQVWKSMEYGLGGCIHLQSVGLDAPILDSVSSLNSFFFNDSLFNSDISHWDVSNITTMNQMFSDATAFNQDLSGWDFSSVINMNSMFAGATSFNQNLGNWDIDSVSSMSNMLDLTALSVPNYDSTLIAWYNQNIPGFKGVGVLGLKYCNAKNERDSLIADGWIFNGDSLDCSSNPLNDFVTTWKTDNPGWTNDSALYISIDNGYSYNYNIDWDNDGIIDTSGLTTGITIQYPQPGIYTIRISGDFPAIRFDFPSNPDNEKLIEVHNWGSYSFKNLEYAFWGCSNLTSAGIDSPNLDSVQSLEQMFGYTGINSNINHWDVSNITNMNGMFHSCQNFNQPLDQWDVSSVTDMSEMFANATVFNGNITTWDVGSVLGMKGMFYHAHNFNQDISSWDVGNVYAMDRMFEDAYAFDQNLGDWDISTVSYYPTVQNYGMGWIFNNTAMSLENYDSTLIAWEAKPHNQNLNFGAAGLIYCLSEASRDSLIADGWLFQGDTLDCSSNPLNDFVTTWKTDNYGGGIFNDSALFINTVSPSSIPPVTYNYDVDWNNDGIFDTLGVTGPILHQYDAPGTYTVRIRGQFPGISFGFQAAPASAAKIISIDQWGSTHWKYLDNAFESCWNLTGNASDTPLLDSLNYSSLERMFLYTLFNQNINDWDVSAITSMEEMFKDNTSFNQDLSSWDVSNVSNMGGMFQNAKAFNQNLGDWDISSVQATAVPLVNGMWAMLDSTALSVANYDSTLIGWSNKPHNQNIGLGSAGLAYCLSKDARDSLMADGWTFYGDTLDCTRISIPESPGVVNAISVYPNPSSGSFTVQFLDHSYSGHLEIYSVSGQRVYQQKVENDNQLELNLSLAKGIYQLKLSSQNQHFTQPLIIQ